MLLFLLNMDKVSIAKIILIDRFLTISIKLIPMLLLLLSSLPQKKAPRARSQASSLKNKEILTLKAWLYWEAVKKYKYAMQ